MLVNEPARVWEIGCGTGLLLLEAAPRCASYLGTDFSAAVVSSLRAEVASRGLQYVQLERRVADDFSSLEPQQFDLVVLNSVVSTFRVRHISRRVLEGAVATLGEGGVVFIGDVRNLRLLEAFHAGVQLYQAEAGVRRHRYVSGCSGLWKSKKNWCSIRSTSADCVRPCPAYRMPRCCSSAGATPMR